MWSLKSKLMVFPSLVDLQAQFQWCGEGQPRPDRLWKGLQKFGWRNLTNLLWLDRWRHKQLYGIGRHTLGCQDDYQGRVASESGGGGLKHPCLDGQVAQQWYINGEGII